MKLNALLCSTVLATSMMTVAHADNTTHVAAASALGSVAGTAIGKSMGGTSGATIGAALGGAGGAAVWAVVGTVTGTSVELAGVPLRNPYG